MRVYALAVFVNLNANLGSCTFVDKLFDNLLVTFTSRLMELSIVWHCPVEYVLTHQWHLPSRL